MHAPVIAHDFALLNEIIRKPTTLLILLSAPTRAGVIPPNLRRRPNIRVGVIRVVVEILAFKVIVIISIRILTACLGKMPITAREPHGQRRNDVVLQLFCELLFGPLGIDFTGHEWNDEKIALLLVFKEIVPILGRKTNSQHKT